MLVYVIETEDLERAPHAYRDSALPVDPEHREVMARVLVWRAEAEDLLDLGLPA